MSKVLVVSKRRPTSVAVMAAPSVERQMNQRRSHRSQTPTTLNLPVRYAALLADPFNRMPFPLGFNTMVPTVIASAYLRNSFAVNGVDGSFSLMLTPDIDNLVNVSNGGAAVSTYTKFSASNIVAIQGQMIGARVLAGGIRAFALFPDTAAPGVLFSGLLNGNSRINNFATASPTQLANFASSELGIGTKGAMAVILPIDPIAQSFQPAVTQGYSQTTAAPWSTAYISGLGFPVGTIVWYEACLHLEGLPIQSATAIGIDSSADTLPSDRYSTYESFVRTAQALVENPVVMDAAEGVRNHKIPGAGRKVHSTRSEIGHGKHANALVGAAIVQHAPQSTLVIEEMKEDAGGGN